MDDAKAQNWRILDEIFDEILDAPPEQKAEILEKRCGSDADLRRKIEQMLESVEQEDFLETPMFEDAFRAFEAETSDALIGQKLGNYTLLEQIGQGGMGAVYLGMRDDKEFRQRVAVKIVSPIFSDKANDENFRRERQILAKLNHPAIARLLDGGTMPNGTPFLVMEYVEGIALTEFCARENLSVKERLNLFLEVCEAVKFAHQNLIIHRDLKPANILVTANGKPKLLDFGVAKLLQPELLDITTDFTVGANILTPNYASPEQLKGENITTASDVYSLGVILFEILTGKRPHDLKSKSLPEILKIITEEVPPLPSEAAKVLSSNAERTLRQLPAKRKQLPLVENQVDFENENRDASHAVSHLKMELRTNPQSLKGDLDTIILKSLAKDATERYQTVGELTADIIRYLNDLPILAQKPSKIYQFKKFVRRNKVAFYGACVIGLLLISLLGTAIYSARVSARQARENLRQAYSSDMNLAMESYETANLVRLHQILEKYKDVDFRGWEYDFLQNLANPKGRISTFGHSAEVWNVAFSPDSRKLATACGDGFARIYEVPGGRLLTQTAVQEKNIWRVRFSPDGKFLATASGDSASSSVKIWNSETGAEVRALVGHTARVRAIDFSPDGKTIATGSQDGTVRIWNTETGAELKQFTFKSEIRQLETQDLRFSRDGTKLLSATNDYALMTEIASGKTLFKIDDLPAWISIALSPDGSRFAFGATTTQIRIYETNTGKMLSEIKEHTGKINNLAFSPDGKFLLSASSDRTIRFFETDSGTEVQNLRVHFADAWSVDFSADGKFIATAGTDFKAFLFDAKILQNSSSFAYRVGGGGGWSAISADRKTVAMPSYLNVGVDQTVWDIETKSQKFVLLSGIDFDSAAFSPDGAILATGRRNGNITYWNMATGAEIRSFPAHDNPELKVIISHLAYSPDGKRLVSGGQDNLVKIWNAETDELIRELWRFESKVSALGISPDGKRIFAASYDLSAKLFDAETGEISFDTGKQTKAILSVAFAPDGKTFATGGADSVIKIWQTADGKLLETITGNAGFTQALTFTPDGTRLVSASGDGVIRLWDMETKAQVLAIRTNSSITDFLAFTPDGKTLISHGTEEKVHLWESFSEF